MSEEYPTAADRLAANAATPPPRDAAQEIDRIKQMLVRAEPEALRIGYLAVPDAAMPVHPGTTTPALVLQYRQGSSGLYVPVGTNPVAPIDLCLVYLTPQEIYGFPLPLNYTVEQLKRTPLESALLFCATVLNSVNAPNAPRRELDIQVAQQWFRKDIAERVINLLRDESRGLVVPQALMLLAREAFEYCPRTLPPGAAPGDIVGALVALSQQMGLTNQGQSTVVSDEPGPLGRELIANQLFNQKWMPTSILARYTRRWRELPAERNTDPQVVDLSQVYEECTGVSLDDLAAVGAFLWGMVLSGGCVASLEQVYRLRLPRERIDSVLSMISADLTWFTEAIAKVPYDKRTEWSFDAFQERPVIRLPDDRLLIMDARHLLNRVFGWLPILDIKNPQKAPASATAHRKVAKRAETALRHLTEVYVSEVLHAITGDAGGIRRVYDDAELNAAFSATGQRIADAAVDYADTWVVIEVTTSQLRRDAATAVPGDSQVQDIDKLIGEIDQIDATIKALRADESRLTGTASTVTRRFMPLLVLPEGFPVNPVTLTVIRERARIRGLLQGQDTDPVEVVDVEELEMIEGMQEEKPGAGLLDILRAKQASSLRNTSLRDYLIHGMNCTVGGPHRLLPAFLSAVEPLRRALPDQ
jgi:hypothetical protein